MYSMPFGVRRLDAALVARGLTLAYGKRGSSVMRKAASSRRTPERFARNILKIILILVPFRTDTFLLVFIPFAGTATRQGRRATECAPYPFKHSGSAGTPLPAALALLTAQLPEWSSALQADFFRSL